MKSSLSAFLFLLLSSFQICLSISRLRRQQTSAPTKTSLKSSSRWDKHLDRVFEEADENNDGWNSFEEVYVRVLLFYIRLNQKAPIPPPSKQRVKTLYQQAD